MGRNLVRVDFSRGRRRLARPAQISLRYLPNRHDLSSDYLGHGHLLISEPQGQVGERQFRETWTAIRGAIGSRTLWIVAGFIFFYNFSPSFGPALVYYATDVLQFSKIFLGGLDSLTYASGIVGIAVYFAFSKSFPFKRLIHFAIAAGVVATLAYLGYRGQLSAVVLSLAFGGIAMFIQLTFLDLAARVCPKQAEATFFALLMSVYNGAVQLSQITGGWLYDQLGFTRLIFISAAFTALCWLLVPLLKLDELELGRKEEASLARIRPGRDPLVASES
jgi:BT1 family